MFEICVSDYQAVDPKTETCVWFWNCHPAFTLASSSSLGTWELLEQPLTKQLRRDWATGASDSKKVIQTAKNASGQGARDLERLANKSDVHANHMRDLRRAIGYPEKAPEITWLDFAAWVGC
jgi:hypothetical protein